LGAKVIGVCSTTNLELVKSLGAHRVIDYTREDFFRNGETYDVIFEAVDKSSFVACMRALKDRGVYLNVTAPVPRPHMLWSMLTSNKRLVLGKNPPERAEDLTFRKELVEDGELKPAIDRGYPLEQIVKARRYVDQWHKKGNVVITVANGYHA
jgi:NADPH:quinone reductase-like Zn-dependent oxidoreductase